MEILVAMRVKTVYLSFVAGTNQPTNLEITIMSYLEMYGVTEQEYDQVCEETFSFGEHQSQQRANDDREEEDEDWGNNSDAAQAESDNLDNRFAFESMADRVSSGILL